ncbi:MAG TPA: hypothetical protein VLA04_03435, partial [Verrucomicrobiae bacterium]|nr:hypothetical protein [Verrucomicrobiae bacterium]
TADIASISTGIAASTWTFSYKLPIAVTLNGPFTSDTLNGATLSVELMDGGTVISTTSRPLPSITNSGLTEEIVVNTTKKTLAGSLSTKVTLLKDGEVIDTLSTPLRPTLDTAGAQNKLAILGGTILALLVLLAALIWVISRKKKSNARTYIPLMLAAGLSFFLGYQVVQASHGVYSGAPYWGQVIIHGGGTVPLEADHCEDEECSETTRSKVGSYTGSPTDACIEARYATSDKGIHVGAPNGWVGPDGEGGTGDDIKASECDTPEGGSDPQATACTVAYEDLDIPEFITPLLRGLFANGTAVSGTYSGSAGPGNQYKIGSAGVAGIAGTGPEDPRDFFKCSEVAIGPEGANSFSSSCGGWYPSQISVGFSLKKISCTENCGGPGMSYFYGGPKADLEIDTMETESPGCKEGETIHCTHNWVYPPIDCNGDGTIGEGIGSGTSGESSVGSGFSSIQVGISSISTTVSTISSSISNPGSDPTSNPGSDPTSDPGSDPTSDPGSDPSTSDPGSDPSTSDPGSDPSTSDPGSDPSTSDPGSDPSTSDPGSDPSTPGTTTGNGKVLNFGLGSRRW